MIILDTCAVIWDALTPDRLAPAARRTIKKARAERSLALSDITLWEIAMLVTKKRLDPGTDYRTFINLTLKANAYAILPITPEIAATSVDLPSEFGGDPADRIIAATTIVNRATLITADERLLRAKSIRTLWR